MENKKDEINKVKKKADRFLNGVKLEKSDTTAIIIAALTTVLPFTLFIILIYFLFMKLVF